MFSSCMRRDKPPSLLWMTLISLFSKEDIRKIVLIKFRDPKTTVNLDNSLEGILESS